MMASWRQGGDKSARWQCRYRTTEEKLCCDLFLRRWDEKMVVKANKKRMSLDKSRSELCELGQITVRLMRRRVGSGRDVGALRCSVSGSSPIKLAVFPDGFLFRELHGQFNMPGRCPPPAVTPASHYSSFPDSAVAQVEMK